jgi:hypothetical protein
VGARYRVRESFTADHGLLATGDVLVFIDYTYNFHDEIQWWQFTDASGRSQSVTLTGYAQDSIESRFERIGDPDARYAAARDGSAADLQAAIAADPNVSHTFAGLLLRTVAPRDDLAVLGVLLDWLEPTETDLTRLLLDAVRADAVGTVRLLLDRGLSPDTDANPSGQTVLLFAAGSDAPRVANLLLERGADPDRADNYGSTPRNTAERNPRVAAIFERYPPRPG